MITKTLARINKAEERLNNKAGKLAEVYCTYQDGHSEIIDIISAMTANLGRDEKEPAERIIHVEPFSEGAETNWHKLYETLKQLVGEWKYIGTGDSLERLERDGRTDPPFDDERRPNDGQ